MKPEYDTRHTHLLLLPFLVVLAGAAAPSPGSAANHDAGANPAPECFEVRRRERRVFTFGVGVHTCPGETLASTIAELGVRQLLDAGLEPDAVLDGLRYRASANTRVPLFGAVG